MRWEFLRPADQGESRQILGTGLHHQLQTNRTVQNLLVAKQNKTSMRKHFVDKH